SSDRCAGPASRSRTSARRRWCPGNGSARAMRSTWSSPKTRPRRIFRSAGSWSCCRSAEALVAVVPAKTGTHTPCPNDVAQNSNNGDAAEYGSPPSRGRHRVCSIVMSPILALEKISKRFGAVAIADGLDLALTQGEALGIIGPNGAGKTTLFGIMTGTAATDVGRVLLDGADIH